MIIICKNSAVFWVVMPCNIGRSLNNFRRM